MAETYELTQATYDRLRAEYEHLTTEWRIDIAQRIEAARELGDLKENGDYHAAKEEQGKTEARIRHIQAMLEGAEIIESGGGDVIAVGSVVGIRFEDSDEIDTYLLGSIEERHGDHEVMSPGSPIGEALLGHKVGDEVTVETPGGTMTIEIVAVEE